MKNILGIARREFGVAFSSPLAYIVVGVFLLVCGIKFFFFPGVFLFQRASYRTFFDWMPAFLAVLAPALTMRLLAEEKKTGTLELLMTLPVRDHEIAIGKWLAATGVIAVGLAFSVVNAFAIAPLAAPDQGFDWGPVAGGYVGTLLLASAFVAVGLFFSSVTKNQVIAFVLATVACAVNLMLSFAIVILPESIGEVCQYLSAYYHFESLGRGVIDWRDVIFFVSVTGGFLLLTTGMLTGNRRVGGDARSSSVILLTLGVLVFVNLFAVRMPLRLDLTRDKMFTLSEATEETMEKLEAPITITAYFTKDLPPPFSDNARYVKDLLDEYRAHAGDNLSFSFVDPQADLETEADKQVKKDVKRDIFGRQVREKTQTEKDLEALDIQAVELTVLESDQQQKKRAYMGISIRYGEEKESLPVVQDTSSLEYDLTTIIRRLTRTKTPVLGVIQGHGEPTPDEGLAKIKGALEQNYEVRPLTLSGETSKVPDDVDALLVIGPNTAYSEGELNAIDDYVMKGKAAGFFLDRAQVDLRTFQPTAVTHGVDALVAAYGLELGTQLVGDAECASLSVPEKRGPFTISRSIPYPFIPTLKSLQGASPLTRGIVGLTLPFVVPVYPKKIDGVETTVLGRSSPKSWLEDPTPEGIGPQRDWQTADVALTGPYDLVATAKGALPSLDGARKSEAEARVFLVGSSTMLNEQVLGQPNAALFLNLVDWLVLDPKLLAMRTRGSGDAPFAPDLSDATRNAVKFGCTAGVPALLVLLGLVRWQLREKKKARLSALGAKS
ncbi:MAG: Gldg family protein [Deltaproteobacteria bacterium]|nr:Gldg family protein [Deltaproteobacteria bacterium]